MPYKRFKREMGVLKNLYCGTFSHFAALFPSILHRPIQVTSQATHETYKIPHWKGFEVRASPFLNVTLRFTLLHE